MGCCPSSAAAGGELREPLLSPSAQHTAAMEPPRTFPPPTVPPPSSASSSSAAPSLSHPPTQPARKTGEAEKERKQNKESVATARKNEGESDRHKLTAPIPPATRAVEPAPPVDRSLKTVDAPRPDGAAEKMTKEEEFEFYKKKMEQLNREKEDINARFQQEEREKQKQLEKLQQQQHAKKPSLRNFFKGGEDPEAEFAIGAPQGFKHESHIGWTPDGGFDIFNIPNEWKQLMTKAGVTEEQMQDKETAMFIVSFVASSLSTKQGPQSAAQPNAVVAHNAKPESERKEADVAPQRHDEEVEGKAEGKGKEIAREEKKESEKAELATEEPSAAQQHAAVPSAPVAPPAPTPIADLGSGEVAPPPPPILAKRSVADEGSSGDVFSAIRGGVTLKKVAALPDVKNLSVEEENTIAGALARALQSRRFAIKEEEPEEEEEEDNGEWDD